MMSTIAVFPIKTMTGSENVEGNHTDVAITEFANNLFVVITQLQKIGTMLTVSRHTVHDSDLPVYNIETLLGVDDPEVHIVARVLAEKLDLGKPILLSLALKQQPTFSTITQLTQLISNLYNQEKQPER